MSDLLVAAKEGDIKALEALMNKSFNPKGILVRVTNSGPLLKITLQGTEQVNHSMSALIKKGLRSIQPKGFSTVFLKAETQSSETLWSEQWKLAIEDTKKEHLNQEVEIRTRFQDALEAGYENLKDDSEAQKSFQRAVQQLEGDEVLEEFIFFLKFSAIRLLGGDQEKLFGVALATDKRIVEFTSNPSSGFDLEIIPYSNISSIEYKEGVFTDEIEFFTSGNSLKINKIVKGNTKAFFDFINQKIRDGSNKNKSQTDVTREDFFVKLEKLLKLRDQGIITPEEYETKKQEWLKNL
jgi:hypothetical protein